MHIDFKVQKPWQKFDFGGFFAIESFDFPVVCNFKGSQWKRVELTGVVSSSFEGGFQKGRQLFNVFRVDPCCLEIDSSFCLSSCVVSHVSNVFLKEIQMWSGESFFRVNLTLIFSVIFVWQLMASQKVCCNNILTALREIASKLGKLKAGALWVPEKSTVKIGRKTV